MSEIKRVEFHPEELEAVWCSLKQAIDDGFSDNDDSPIVTAFIKVEEQLASVRRFSNGGR